MSATQTELEKDCTHIRSSDIGNTYGGLSLVRGPDKHAYLRMDDGFGPTFYGPLNTAQIDAYNVLCTVKEV